MRLDMADVKPTILNMVVVTMLAAIGIHFMKFFSAQYNIPGLKELFGSL